MRKANIGARTANKNLARLAPTYVLALYVYAARTERQDEHVSSVGHIVFPSNQHSANHPQFQIPVLSP